MAGSGQFQQTRQAQQKCEQLTFAVPEKQHQHHRQAQTQAEVREQPQPQQYRYVGYEQEQHVTFSLQVRQFMQRLLVEYMIATGGVLPQVNEEALFNVVAAVFTVEDRLRRQQQLNISFNSLVPVSAPADNGGNNTITDNIFARFPTTLSANPARRVDDAASVNSGGGSSDKLPSPSSLSALSAPAFQMGLDNSNPITTTAVPAPAPASTRSQPLTWRAAHTRQGQRQGQGQGQAVKDHDQTTNINRDTNKKGNYRGMYARCQPEEVGTGYNYMQNFGEEAERIISQYSRFPLWELGPKFYKDCVAFVALLLAWRNFVLFADVAVGDRDTTTNTGQSGGQARYRYVALPTEKMRLEINLQSARLRTTGADSVIAALRRAGILVTARAANVGEQTVLPLCSSDAETETESVPSPSPSPELPITAENREGEEYDEYVPVEQVARYKARAARLMTYEGGATYGFWNERVFQPNTVYYRLADGIRLSPAFESEGSIGARPFNPFPPKLAAHTFSLSLGFHSQKLQPFGGRGQQQNATTELESGVNAAANTDATSAEAEAEAEAGWGITESQAIENNQQQEQPELQPQLPIMTAAAVESNNNYSAPPVSVGLQSGVSQASSVRQNQLFSQANLTDRRLTEDRLTPDSTAFSFCSFDDFKNKNNDDDEQASNAYIRASAKTKNPLLSSKEGTGTGAGTVPEADQNSDLNQPQPPPPQSGNAFADLPTSLEAEAAATLEVSAGRPSLLGEAAVVEAEAEAVADALTTVAAAVAATAASNTNRTRSRTSHAERLTRLLEELEPDRLEVFNSLHYAYLRLTDPDSDTDPAALVVNVSQTMPTTTRMPDSKVSVRLKQKQTLDLSQASSSVSVSDLQRNADCTGDEDGACQNQNQDPLLNRDGKVKQMSSGQALYFARLPEGVLSKATVVRLVDEWERQYEAFGYASWHNPTGMLVSWLNNSANGGSAQTGSYSSAETALNQQHQHQHQNIVTARSGAGASARSEAKLSYGHGHGKNLKNQNSTTEGGSSFKFRNPNQTHNNNHQNRKPKRRDVTVSWSSPLPPPAQTLTVGVGTVDNAAAATGGNLSLDREEYHIDVVRPRPHLHPHSHTSPSTHEQALSTVDSEETLGGSGSGFSSEPDAVSADTSAPAHTPNSDPEPDPFRDLTSASASASVSTATLNSESKDSSLVSTPSVSAGDKTKDRVSDSRGRGRGRVGRALDPEPEKLNASWAEIVEIFFKKHRVFEKFRPALQEASLEYELGSRVLAVRFGNKLLDSKQSGRKWMLDTLKREVESQFPSSTYSEVALIEP